MLTEMGSHSTNIVDHMQFLLPHFHMLLNSTQVCPFIETWKPDMWCI